jgi:long-subunit fatty acid transport protein
METTELFDVSGGTPVRVEQDLDGFDPMPGVTVGATYRLLPGTRIGASYRSQMSVDMDGTTTMMMPAGPVDAATRSAWSTPHAFHLGATHSFGRLTMSAEGAIKLYDRANDRQAFVMDVAGAESRTDLDLDWNRTIEGHVGGEYALGRYALRAGYGIAQSATPRTTASAFAPPPGAMHAMSIGGGGRFADIQLDVAATLFSGGADVEASVNGQPGRYEFTAGLVSLAGTFLR